MYLVKTIGALGDVGPPPTLKGSTSVVDVGPLVTVGVVGVLVGALGFWAWGKRGKKRR